MKIKKTSFVIKGQTKDGIWLNLYSNPQFNDANSCLEYWEKFYKKFSAFKDKNKFFHRFVIAKRHIIEDEIVKELV